MARRRKKRKITAWNRRFGDTAKVCFKGASSMKAFGSCMRSELKGKSGRRKRRR